jgi:hypothetical protein
MFGVISTYDSGLPRNQFPQQTNAGLGNIELSSTLKNTRLIVLKSQVAFI